MMDARPEEEIGDSEVDAKRINETTSARYSTNFVVKMNWRKELRLKCCYFFLRFQVNVVKVPLIYDRFVR